MPPFWENDDTPADHSRIKHGYDRGSNRLYRKDTVGSAKDELFGYDALHRLTGMDRGTLNGGKDSITSRAFALTWTLSTLGNWNEYQYDSDGTTGSGWDLEQTRTHNDANEITAIGATTGTVWADPAHDAAGNMTTITKPNTPTETFTGYYDAWNRLTKLTNDADKRLIPQGPLSNLWVAHLADPTRVR